MDELKEILTPIYTETLCILLNTGIRIKILALKCRWGSDIFPVPIRNIIEEIDYNHQQILGCNLYSRYLYKIPSLEAECIKYFYQLCFACFTTSEKIKFTTTTRFDHSRKSLYISDPTLPIYIINMYTKILNMDIYPVDKLFIEYEHHQCRDEKIKIITEAIWERNGVFGELPLDCLGIILRWC